MLTDMVSTIRLFAAGGSSAAIAEGDFTKIEKQSACAAARETGGSDFPGRWPIQTLSEQG